MVRLLGLGATAVVLALCDPVLAKDYQSGNLRIQLHGGATVGTSIRTSHRDPTLIPSLNGTLVGVAGRAISGRNQDDGNLNFAKGQPVSTVAKGWVSIDASVGNVGVFARGMAWFDYTLTESGFPWGNLPNGYAAGQPLSDRGFSNAARFSSASLQQAYIYGTGNIGPATVLGKVGLQTIAWGSLRSIPGGLFTSINAIDANALNRPGVLVDDVVLPAPAAFGKIDVTKKLSLEGFYQFARSGSQLPGCGTFFSAADIAAPGCNAIVLGNVDDRTALANGSFVTRGSSPDHSEPQFGFSGTYLFDEVATKAGVYYAHVDSRALSGGVIKSTRIGPPFIPGNADGKNLQYFTEYAPGTDVLSGIFTTRLGATTISGEATWRHNVPVSLNFSDVLNAFASNTAASLLRADATATAAGGHFRAYDNFDLGHYQLRVSQRLPAMFGASGLLIGGEVAYKHAFGLPDVNVRRYGRPDNYGVGPVAGVCPAGAPASQCSTDGYVTSNAWGYRLNAALRFEDAFTAGLTLTPSVGIAHDVKGWSADTVFNEGRMVMKLGLRAQIKSFFALVTWNPALAKSDYDNKSDRQILTIASGIRF